MDPPALQAIRRTLQFLRDIQALRSLSDTTPTQPPPDSASSVPVAALSKMTKKQRKRFVNGAIEAGKTAVAATTATASTSSTNQEDLEMEEDNDVLTPLGYHLANLPLDPQCAKLLILGALFSCLKPALAVAACLAFKEPFEAPLGAERPAEARKAELTEDSQSDHWAFHVVLSVSLFAQWRQLHDGHM